VSVITEDEQRRVVKGVVEVIETKILPPYLAHIEALESAEFALYESIALAVSMLSEHIDAHHDDDSIPESPDPERQSLCGVVHHLEGILMSMDASMDEERAKRAPIEAAPTVHRTTSA
jgi:hypothetical protein